MREALSERPGDIDCVLLDLGLPDGFGVETVHRVRAVAPRIAVIVLTGLDNEGAAEAAVDAGAQDYLVKGRVDAGLPTRAIRYAVGRRHAENIQQQLQVAEIQAEENARLERGLVPHPIIHDRSIWIASSYVPRRSRALLGGDFFDAVETPDGLLHVMIGDVSGHGPDEAALGAGLRIAWRAFTLSGAPADHVLPHAASGDRARAPGPGDVRDRVRTRDLREDAHAEPAARGASYPGAPGRGLDNQPAARRGRAAHRHLPDRAVGRDPVRPPRRLVAPALHRRHHRRRPGQRLRPSRGRRTAATDRRLPRARARLAKRPPWSARAAHHRRRGAGRPTDDVAMLLVGARSPTPSE